MRFENLKDLNREFKAIELFVSTFNGSYQKLGDNDIDFKVFDSNNKLISYVEVKGRLRVLKDSFPLPVAIRKLVKLSDKRINPVIIWACEDGIIYSLIESLSGQIKYSGRKKREWSHNDLELMAYFNNNKNFKIIKY
tara:strand:+ start:50 stop:460 length:411 start_codon:yes stop_codon:yes gene_type:complete